MAARIKLRAGTHPRIERRAKPQRSKTLSTSKALTTALETEREKASGTLQRASHAASRTPGGDVKFVDGNKNGRGRPPGSTNKVSAALKECIILAAARVGFNGRGKNGLLGYCESIARSDKKTYAGLMKAVLPLQVKASVTHNHRSFRSREEVIKDLRERGLNIDTIYNADTGVFEPDIVPIDNREDEVEPVELEAEDEEADA